MPPVQTADAQSLPSTHAVTFAHVGAQAAPQAICTSTTFAPLMRPDPLLTLHA